MVWAIDRLGRSLIDLLGTIEHLEKVGVDLYLEQQHMDTTTPIGKLLFQITGAFAEFERTMIKTRVRAGMQTVKNTLRPPSSSPRKTELVFYVVIGLVTGVNACSHQADAIITGRSVNVCQFLGLCAYPYF